MSTAHGDSGSAAIRAGEQPDGSAGPPGRPSQHARFTERSWPTFWGLALVVLGGAWLASVAGADVPWQAVPALLLAASGIGLIAGGRDRTNIGLIVIGVVLLAFAAMAAQVPQGAAAGGVGQQTHVIDDPSEVRNLELGVGEMTVDLRGLDPGGETLEAEIDQGMGRLIILLPEDVDVQLESSVGMGEVLLPGELQGDNAHGGVGVQREERLPAEGESRGELRLMTNLGMGSTEVRR